mgnify:CR=1 FL=1
MQKKELHTLCRCRHAIVPSFCRFCNKQIYILQPFYKIPWYIAVYFYGGIISYQDFCSDHHCKECHDKKIDQLGHCPKCQAFVVEKKLKKTKLVICLR